MSQDKTAFTDAQKSEIQEMVRDYILQNPGIIVEAFGILEAREQAAQQQRVAQVMAEYAEDIERDPKDPVMGNPDGDVTVVEFFDYQCGYCKSMLKPLLAFAAEDGNVRIVMKEFPILGPASIVAAQASLASAKQGKYDAFHTALMGLRGRLDEAAIFQTATEVGHRRGRSAPTCNARRSSSRSTRHSNSHRSSAFAGRRPSSLVDACSRGFRGGAASPVCGGGALGRLSGSAGASVAPHSGACFHRRIPDRRGDGPMSQVEEFPYEMTDAEWRTRVDLAAAFRLVELYGWSDMLATHLSARVPGPEEHFLINAFGLMFEEITASSMVKVDVDGNELSPSEYGINPAGFVIHGAVHEARPELACVIHTHTAAGLGVATQEDGLLPLTQQSLSVIAHTGYHDYQGIAFDLAEREAFSKTSATTGFWCCGTTGC